jgi:hypothetical protein
MIYSSKPATYLSGDSARRGCLRAARQQLETAHTYLFPALHSAPLKKSMRGYEALESHREILHTQANEKNRMMESDQISNPSNPITYAYP